MSVELDPPELGFRRPFTQEVTQVLHLRNKNVEPVAFKARVKTTAPKQYCVRPNSGRIEPGGSVEIQVLLQAMKEDPPLDAKCRDKFLVQSTSIAQEHESDNITAIWSSIEKVSKESIKERKIRVSFLPAEGTGSELGIPHDAHHEDAPPAYQSASPIFGSPQPDRSFETPAKHTSRTSILTTPSAAMASASSVISDAASATGQTLQQQLDAAKATIAQLRSQTEEHGLRQRKTDATSQDGRERITTGTTGMGMQTQAADGVPVQIVAALCLLSFLLAYFFF